MSVFLDWFNAPAAADEVLRASLVHLWFVSIHPLDDGNLDPDAFRPSYPMTVALGQLAPLSANCRTA